MDDYEELLGRHEQVCKGVRRVAAWLYTSLVAMGVFLASFAVFEAFESSVPGVVVMMTSLPVAFVAFVMMVVVLNRTYHLTSRRLRRN